MSQPEEMTDREGSELRRRSDLDVQPVNVSAYNRVY